jgi:gas vesicle protein
MAHTHSVLDNPVQLVGIAAIAATAGALAAMLFTPKSGSQTRQEIRMRALDMRDKMQHSKDSMSDTLNGSVDRMNDTVQNARTRAKGTIRKISDDATATKEELSDNIDQTKNDMHDEAEHIRKHGER